MSAELREELSVVLDRIDIDMALERLPETDRLIVELAYAYRCPQDYTYEWPPTSESIGRYLAKKQGRKCAFGARTIQLRYRRAIAHLCNHEI